MKHLHVVVGHNLLADTPYHVDTSNGVRLASFPTQRMAEAYVRSALVKIAVDLRKDFGQDDREEETLS